MEVPSITKKREVAQGFLSIWFDSEGNVSKDNYYHRRIRGFSVNLSGLQQIKRLLLNFGIQSHIGPFTKNKNNNTLTKNPKPYYYICIEGKQRLIAFRTLIGFQIPKKRDKLNEVLASYANG